MHQSLPGIYISPSELAIFFPQLACFFFHCVICALFSYFFCLPTSNTFFQSVLSFSFIHNKYLFQTEVSNLCQFKCDIFLPLSFSLPQVYRNITLYYTHWKKFQYSLGFKNLVRSYFCVYEANNQFLKLIHSLFQHHVINCSCFPHWLEIIYTYACVSVWDKIFYSISFVYLLFLKPIPCCFDYCDFTMCFAIWWGKPLWKEEPPFKTLLAITVHIRMNFEIIILSRSSF